jgi:hypothetical protein
MHAFLSQMRSCLSPMHALLSRNQPCMKQMLTFLSQKRSCLTQMHALLSEKRLSIKRDRSLAALLQLGQRLFHLLFCEGHLLDLRFLIEQGGLHLALGGARPLNP